MSDTAALQTVRGIRLFESLDDKLIEQVDRNCAWKHYPKGEQIIDRQSETRDVFFVAGGRVRVVNYSLSGREITLDDLDAGHYFGQLAAIDSRPRSASVMALTDCMLGAAPPDFFMDLCRENSFIAFNVMLSLTHIVRVSTDRIMDLSTLAANNRVHAELLRQARASMLNDREAVISPIPVHGDIASRVSTTRETVARVMNDLARQGVVERSKDKLLIRNIDALAGMVEEVRGE
ncbi:MAG: Crp/Fnr family transcriptional regulator [Rhodospirillales bacterium]